MDVQYRDHASDDWTTDWANQAGATAAIDEVTAEDAVAALRHALALQGLRLPATPEEALRLILRHGLLSEEGEEAEGPPPRRLL